LTLHWRGFDDAIKKAASAKPKSPKPSPSNKDAELWAAYTEDVFYGLIWRWHYKPEIDNKPRNVTPYCTECNPPRPLGGFKYVDGNRGYYRLHLECKLHSSIHHECNVDDYAHIKKLIEKKLDDGSWKLVVDRQQVHRSRKEN
jgi:hypothetical protein